MPESRDFDVRCSTASQLIIELMHVEDTLSATAAGDPMFADLMRREQRIREELNRREVLLMEGLRWTTLSTSAASRMAGRAVVHAVKTRNGRGGPGGPGRWDD